MHQDFLFPFQARVGKQTVWYAHVKLCVIGAPENSICCSFVLACAAVVFCLTARNSPPQPSS